MAQSKELVIVYEGETYSLLKVPESQAKLVLSAKQRMMQTINLSQLAKDLSNLGMLLRLAFNGVVGYIDLQIKVRKIFYNVVRLCDESVHTINEFQRASDTALESLQATYEYLVDGLDELAIINLEEIAGVAGQMKAAAKKLSEEFRKEALSVQKLEEETSQEESKARESSSDKEKQRKQAEIDKDKQKQIFDDMVEDEIKSEMEYESARKKELEQIENQKFGFFKTLVNAMITDKEGKGVYEADREAAKKAASIHGEDKEKYYKEMMEAKVKRRLALENMASFAKKMEQLDSESKLESAAAESLHHAAAALLGLSDVMEKAGRFWQETESLCQQLNSPKMTKQIKQFSKLSEEKRRKAWERDAFKLDGIKYFCNWVAIKEICQSYRGAIQDAQREVHAYIRENPTQPEARITVKQLAPVLNDIIQKELAVHDKKRLPAIEN